MNDYHEANRKCWNGAVRAGTADHNAGCDWRECHRDPSIILDEREMRWLGDLAGKRVSVLGSGDNRAVFALAGLGAEVTSVDISEEQLRLARERAETLGLRISFLRADVTDLSEMESGSFDLVYTGGHVAVWVSDLAAFYAEAARVLAPGGMLMVSEYHPFRRIWDDTKPELEVRFNYFDTGPQQWDWTDEIQGEGRVTRPSYEFHWTVSQYMTAVLDAGCEIVAVDEFDDRPHSHETGPSLAGLPGCLLIVARKRERS